MERIEIRFVEMPDPRDPESIIRWFCRVFGLATEEGDSIEEQIFRNFVEAAYTNRGLSSSELKLDTELSRSTVIYHLNRFIESGLLVKHGRRYSLRASELSKAIEEIEYDINREMSRMLNTAREYDRLMLAKASSKKRK
jgi:predicted DNA-binding transcriptional regulator